MCFFCQNTVTLRSLTLELKTNFDGFATLIDIKMSAKVTRIDIKTSAVKVTLNCKKTANFRLFEDDNQ